MLITESQILPPISTFINAHQQGGLVIEAHENYQKKSLRNRFFLASPKGRIGLSIPLKKGKSNQTKIKTVEISYDEDWIKDIVHTISTLLGKSAYYNFYIHELIEILEKRFQHLWKLNNTLLKWVLERGEMKMNIEYTSSYIKEYTVPYFDHRSKPLSYYHNDTSNKCIEYDQIFMLEHGFIRNLSILDLLMQRGPETGILVKNCLEDLHTK